MRHRGGGKVRRNPFMEVSQPMDLRNPTPGEPLYVNGRPVPFSFWPAGYMQRGPLRAANPWQCLLSVIRSNGRDDRRVRAYIEQSRDFYQAATAASVTTRPLMLYYSYLNLVMAFFVDREGGDAFPARRCHHGLSLLDLPDEYPGLSGVGCRTPAEQGDSYDVFPNLVRLCRFPPQTYRALTLASLLYQIPGLHDGFIATHKRPRAFYPVALEFRYGREDKSVWAYGEADTSSQGTAERQTLCTFLEACEDLQLVQGRDGRLGFESAPVGFGGSGKEQLQSVVEPLRRHLWSEQTPSGFRYYLSCGVGFTAQVAANFAVMYTLGMIVRYSPEYIEELAGEWLIHEYLATQPIQFAYLLGSGLIRNEILPVPNVG